MNRSKALMLPKLASLALLLIFTSNPALCQAGEEQADTTVAPITTTSTTSATPEITTLETTTSTITTQPPSQEALTSESAPSPTSIPEGPYNSPCNATYDCQPNKNLECLEGVCHCPDPQHFDLHVERCVIPLGKECDSADIIGENICPEFGECFMDRCVCKTGYSMHTLTRCKSDSIEPSERKPVVLWPRQQVQAKSKEDDNDNTSLGGCTSETCDESKGLICQEETCTCKDSTELYIEEFGRCLNTTTQKTLKDALSLVSTSEDEIKSFVKLLEKFDDADQDTEGSDHYNSPVHQLLGLLGGDEYRNSHPSGSSQVAPPHSYNGDLHSAAQENVPESTLPASSGAPAEENLSNSGATNDGGGNFGGSSPSQSNFHPSPESPISPVSAANAESSVESGEAMPYSSESPASDRSPSHHLHLPLDNLQYSPQSQEPSIVQRQAPPYLQGGEGIPLNGLGVIPGGNQFRLPIQGGYGGIGGGYGGLGGGYGGLGGYEGGLGGYGGGGPQGGCYGQGGFGGPQGFGGGFGGPQGGGFGGPVGHHGVPPPKEEAKEGLLFDVAEFVGKTLKLIDRFLPLVGAINDVLKKEKIFDLKKEGPFKGLKELTSLLAGGGGEGPRGRRFGDISKEIDELKEGGILSGFARFVGILVRLKKRLLLSGDGSLKKLLA